MNLSTAFLQTLEGGELEEGLLGDEEEILSSAGVRLAIIKAQNPRSLRMEIGVHRRSFNKVIKLIARLEVRVFLMY